MAPEVKEAYQHLVMKLETLICNYKVYEEHKTTNFKSLNQLTELRAQKEDFRGQFKAVDLGQKTKQ